MRALVGVMRASAPPRFDVTGQFGMGALWIKTREIPGQHGTAIELVGRRHSPTKPGPGWFRVPNPSAAVPAPAELWPTFHPITGSASYVDPLSGDIMPRPSGSTPAHLPPGMSMAAGYSTPGGIPVPGVAGLGVNTAAIGAGAAQGATAGAVLGPWGAAGGAVIGGGAAYMATKDEGDGAGDGAPSSGPGSLAYWRSQLQQIQAITHNANAPGNVRAAASTLAVTYKRHIVPGGPYPVIPQDQIAALRQAAGTGSVFGGGSGATTAIVAVVAIGAIGFGAWYLMKKRGRRRR